jgi:hypothetical protein
VSVMAWCANGHHAVVDNVSPQTCMWCGDALYTLCPSGHPVWLGQARCPVCGSTMGPQPGAPVVRADPPAPAAVPAVVWTRPLPLLTLGTNHVAARRRNSKILAAALVAFTVVTVIASTLIVSSTSQRSGPLTPEQPIAGRAITLPSSLYLANAPESGQPLVTADQAESVATAMWSLWQQALVHNDTRALTQLISPGFLLQGELYNCVWPNGGCVQQRTPFGTQSIVPVVPVQRTYPLYFMAQVTTKAYVQNNSGGPDTLEPWLELQILTKASPSAPWRISFDSGYNAANGATPALLPTDGAGLPCTSPQPDCLAYNPAPVHTPPVPAAQYLSHLSSYWQSWKVHKAAPAHTLFVRDGDTSGFGSSLAQNPEDSANHYDFHLDAGQGVWTFSAWGYPMMCGTIVDTSKALAGSGSFNQNPDRTNYGMQLPPGLYSSIVTQTTHQTCVWDDDGAGLDAAGTDGYAVTITGTRAG